MKLQRFQLRLFVCCGLRIKTLLFGTMLGLALDTWTGIEQQCCAQTFWNNPSGGLWQLGSNWSSGVAPGPTSVAIFNQQNSNYTVTWSNQDSVTSGLVVANGGVTFANSLGTPRTYTVLGNAAVTGSSTALYIGSQQTGPFLLRAGTFNVEGGASLHATAGGRVTSDGLMTIGRGVGQPTSMHVGAGAIVQAGSARIGDGASTAAVYVQGAGAQLLSTGDLVVGYNNQTNSWNKLTVAEGGYVQSGKGVIGRSLSNSQGGFDWATVDGEGSRWVATELDVGVAGDGLLNVANGGTVISGNDLEVSRLGVNAGSKGSVWLFGSGSQWQAGRVNVGDAGTGSLTIEQGARANTFDLNVGVQAGSSGTIVVQGSRLEDRGTLKLGIGGNGHMNILNGYVGTGMAFFGSSSFGGRGTALISGASSLLDVFSLNIQNGSIAIDSGAGLSSGGDINIGATPGQSALVTVSGVNSRLETFFNDLHVGSASTGTLQVLNGGNVYANAGFIGNDGGNGFVTVSGNGSQLRLSQLQLGFGDTGIVNLENQGLLNAGNVSIGNGGQVRLNGGRYEFGSTNIASFTRVLTNSGSAAGNIDISGSNNLASMNGLISNGADLNKVKLRNSGLLQGTNQVDVSLLNIADGELRATTGEWIRFRGNENQNNGVIQNNGGLIQFDGLVNYGTIQGNGYLAADAELTNYGTMSFAFGHSELIGNVSNLGDGVISTSGASNTFIHGDLLHNGAAIQTQAGSSTTITGLASGAGDYHGEGRVTMQGGYRPGNSPDIVNFYGLLAFGEQNTTYFELGGPNAGEYDQLLIDGDLLLGNSLLDVSLWNGFTLGSDMQFLIADVEGSIAGQFSGLNEGGLVGTFGGTDMFITYNGFQGNRGVGLYTLSTVPEPSGVGCIMLLGACIFLRRGSRTTARRHTGD